MVGLVEGILSGSESFLLFIGCAAQFHRKTFYLI